MAIKGLKVTKTELSQDIDFDALAGAPISLDPVLQREIAQATIDYIKTRVEDENLGIGRKKLKSPYQKSYEESLDFKAAGKSASNVNMMLSGDMMGSIDVLEEGETVKIGIDNPAVTDRAYGHQSGFEGHPNPKMSKYKREFFGVSDEEIKKNILPDFQSDIDALKEGLRPSARDLETASTQDDLFRFINGVPFSELFDES
jgi:hypothetical protein